MVGGGVFDLVDDGGAGDVGGHEVGGELDAAEVEAEGLGDGSDEERFADARDAFEEDVARGEEGDEGLLDDLIVADDGFGDLLAEGGEVALEAVGGLCGLLGGERWRGLRRWLVDGLGVGHGGGWNGLVLGRDCGLVGMGGELGGWAVRSVWGWVRALARGAR